MLFYELFFFLKNCEHFFIMLALTLKRKSKGFKSELNGILLIFVLFYIVLCIAFYFKTVIAYVKKLIFSHLSNYIQLSADNKTKNYKINSTFVRRGLMPRLIKLVLILNYDFSSYYF